MERYLTLVSIAFGGDFDEISLKTSLTSFEIYTHGADCFDMGMTLSIMPNNDKPTKLTITYPNGSSIDGVLMNSKVMIWNMLFNVPTLFKLIQG